MVTGRTDEFRKDAVRIALTSGLSRRQIADDLGVGVSTLNKWVNAHRDTDGVSAEDRELARRITAWARDPHPQGFEPDPRNSLGGLFSRRKGEILEKSHPVLREPKAVRFRFVEEQRGAFPIDRLCQVRNVSPRGLRAFCSRPASRWQRMDRVVLGPCQGTVASEPGPRWHGAGFPAPGRPRGRGCPTATGRTRASAE